MTVTAAGQGSTIDASEVLASINKGVDAANAALESAGIDARAGHVSSVVIEPHKGGENRPLWLGKEKSAKTSDGLWGGHNG